MKVMQILPALNSGGVERGTLEMGRALVKAGHTSIVVSSGGSMVSRLEREGSTHLSLPVHQKSFSSLLQVYPLRQLIRDHHPDIVHVRSRIPAWITHFALKGLHVAERPHLVTTVHGLYSVSRYSAIMTKGEKVIAVSDCVVDYIRDNYPACPPDKIVRIYRGIDPRAFPYRYQPSVHWFNKIFAEYPQLENKIWITLPGRVSRSKGHEWLFDVIGGVRDDFPELHALVIGGTKETKSLYLDELKDKVAALGIEDRVTFTGKRDDMREWLAASNLVLSLSNKPETFGRTTLEALALGTPVIGWDKGGVSEVMQALYPQGLVPPDDALALCQRIREHLTNPIIPDKPNQFLLKQMTDQTIAVYESLLNPTFYTQKTATTASNPATSDNTTDTSSTKDAIDADDEAAAQSEADIATELAKKAHLPNTIDPPNET